MFHQDKAQREHAGDNGEQDDRRRSPGSDAPAQGSQQDQAAGRDRQQHGAQVVNPMLTRLTTGSQGQRQHEQGSRAKRQIDVENPAPGQGLDKKTAQQGSGHAAHPKDGAEHTLIASELTWRHDIGDDSLGEYEDAPTSQPLQAAEENEFGQVLAEAAQRRSEEKEHNRRLEEPLTPVKITELTPQWGGDR